MADFATTEDRSEDEDEPMEDDNDFLADDAPAASTSRRRSSRPNPLRSPWRTSRPSKTRRTSGMTWTLVLLEREAYRAI